ncbi:MAG: hypothetical protein ACYDBB_26905 [Armatimonadota bacterium]
MLRHSYHLLLGCLLLALTAAVSAAPRFADGQARPVTRVFEMHEWLEHAYSSEMVSYPVTFKAGECRVASLRLVDDAGKELPYQLTDVKLFKQDGSLRSAKVWFVVDALPAMGWRSFTLYGSKSPRAKAPTWPKSSITWTNLDADTVEVSNGIFTLKLAGNTEFSEPKRASEIGGPLHSFKGVDGVWRGAGELQVESPVVGHSLQIIEQGPLWTTFACRYDFVSPPGGGGTQSGPYYEMRFKMFPGQDFCRVTEKSDFPVRLQPMPRDCTGIPEDPKVTDNWRMLPCPADNFIINVDAGWKADHLYTQNCWSRKFIDHPLLPDQFRCHTAIRAALPMMDAGWFSTYSSKGNDLLGIVGIDAAHWQYPDNAAHPTAGTPGRNSEIMFLNEPGKGAYFRLPLARMERHWLLVVTSKDKVVKDPAWVEAQKKKGYYSWFGPRIEPETCYLWQLRYKHGDLPLNKVKDWILDYDEPQANHPNLFPEAKDRDAVMKRIADFPAMQKHFDTMYNTSPYLQYIKTGKFEPKPSSPDQFTDTGINCVKEHMSQGFNAGIYVLSMGQYVPWMFQFNDVVAPAVKPEDWKKMCRFALAGAYIMADDDYWQYAYIRDKTTYIPNFNTCRWYGVGMTGLFFPNHPESKKWINFSRYYLEKEFDYHISVDGVGEENIGSYYPFAWRMITQLVRLFQERGIADYRKDPKFVAGAQVFLDVITPKDPRFPTPRRMIPPIGHHPYNTPGQAGLYEWNAGTLQPVNPELAAQSHWAWLECNTVPDYHYLMPLNYLWANKDFPAKAPALQSKALKDFGYIFRNHFPSDKETYMSFKAGRVNFHHDGDEGSFHMFGKGVPLAVDGLELIAHSLTRHHNSVEISKEESDKRVPMRAGELTAHFESPVVDWAQGFFAKEKTANAEFMIPKLHTTDWFRNLMLVKAKDPEGAEYFVVYDNLSGPDTSSWNLDVLSEEPVVEPAADGKLATIRYPGIKKPLFNVGLDVIIVTPANPVIEKEKGTINKDQLPNFPTLEHWFIHSPREAKEDTLAILFPRRADQPMPKVTPLLNGKGCIVEHQNGRDIIFASTVPVTYNANGIEFTGRYAIIRDRGADSSITLLDGTKLSFKGKTLTEKGTIAL